MPTQCASKHVNFIKRAKLINPFLGQLPPGQLPLGQLPPRTLPPKTAATQDNCHPDNCHLQKLPPRTTATIGQRPPRQPPPRTIATQETATWGIMSFCVYSYLNFTRMQCITKISSSSDHFKKCKFNFGPFGWRMSCRYHYIFANILKSVQSLILYGHFQLFHRKIFYADYRIQSTHS